MQFFEFSMDVRAELREDLHRVVDGQRRQHGGIESGLSSEDCLCFAASLCQRKRRSTAARWRTGGRKALRARGQDGRPGLPPQLCRR